METFPQTLEQIEENVTNWAADDHEAAPEESEHQEELGEEQM